MVILFVDPLARDILIDQNINLWYCCILGNVAAIVSGIIVYNVTKHIFKHKDDPIHTYEYVDENSKDE